ncbi:MAG: acetylxylan esterase [Cyclobacteriaceae bacterium]|nr:acetylxylan esterase [Cyclobacteriaceae bacterium]
MNSHHLLSFFLLNVILFSSNFLIAQPRKELVEINLAPDHSDWIYEVGEKVNFNVSILKYGIPLTDIEIRYVIRPEKMDPVKEETITIKHSETMIKGGTMNTPGFLRCWVYTTIDGKEYRNMATAAFAPEQIEPTASLPDDFSTFWENAIAKNKEIPMDVKMTLLPERCTEKVNVYHVSLQNYKKRSRIYGILCKPKKEGNYPAVLAVPGAGIRPYYGVVDIAEEGIITFQIGIHGIPVTMEPYVYDNLRYGALNGYQTMNLDDKDIYYYKRVYLGCVRAVDFITSLPEYDGTNLAVTGGSQGGALSIITAGLDKRIKYLAAFYPALSDLSGYLNGRAGGWPHVFSPGNSAFIKDDKIETAQYYDVVNFARQVTQTGWYSWGFNDTTCPPTSMYSAYNVVNAPKELHIFQDTGHWTYPEQGQMKKQWLLEKLK